MDGKEQMQARAVVNAFAAAGYVFERHPLYGIDDVRNRGTRAAAFASKVTNALHEIGELIAAYGRSFSAEDAIEQNLDLVDYAVIGFTDGELAEKVAAFIRRPQNRPLLRKFKQAARAEREHLQEQREENRPGDPEFEDELGKQRDERKEGKAMSLRLPSGIDERTLTRVTKDIRTICDVYLDSLALENPEVSHFLRPWVEQVTVTVSRSPGSRIAYLDAIPTEVSRPVLH